jgi:hypothetical protein
VKILGRSINRAPAGDMPPGRWQEEREGIMAVATWVKEMLERRGVAYEERQHPEFFTAQEVADGGTSAAIAWPGWWPSSPPAGRSS